MFGRGVVVCLAHVYICLFGYMHLVGVYLFGRGVIGGVIAR